MLEDLINAFLRSQFGDVKRRTTGAILEVAALGMVGLATVFLSIGLCLWLSTRMDVWEAALIVAVAALVCAVALMLIGRAMLHRKARRQHDDIASALGALSSLTRSDATQARRKTDDEEPGVAIVGAALAAGVLLGRSVKR